MTDPNGAQGGAENTSAQGGTGETGQQQENAEAANAGTGNEGNKDAQSGAEPTVSRADFERLKAQLQAADRNREAAMQELKQLKDKDLPELDKLKRDLAEATEKLQQQQQRLQDQAIDNAFYGANKHTWHDPRAARRLLDLDGVQVGEDGTVSGMDSAIEKLAKANPWMLKPADGEKSGGGAGAPPMNGKTGTSDNKNAQAAQLQRFPALRTRQK